jgi:hypothetical protein
MSCGAEGLEFRGLVPLGGLKGLEESKKLVTALGLSVKLRFCC